MWFCSRGGRGACVVVGGACVVARGHAWLGACVVAGGHARDTTRHGQWAGGMHPTGMHSCSFLFLFAGLWRQQKLRGRNGIPLSPQTYVRQAHRLAWRRFEVKKIVIIVSWKQHRTYKYCIAWCVLVFMHFSLFFTQTQRNWEFRRHRKWSLNGQFQCSSKKTTEHKLHKFLRSLNFCKNSGKRAHP